MLYGTLIVNIDPHLSKEMLDKYTNVNKLALRSKSGSSAPFSGCIEKISEWLRGDSLKSLYLCDICDRWIWDSLVESKLEILEIDLKPANCLDEIEKFPDSLVTLSISKFIFNNDSSIVRLMNRILDHAEKGNLKNLRLSFDSPSTINRSIIERMAQKTKLRHVNVVTERISDFNEYMWMLYYSPYMVKFTTIDKTLKLNLPKSKERICSKLLLCVHRPSSAFGRLGPELVRVLVSLLFKN